MSRLQLFFLVPWIVFVQTSKDSISLIFGGDVSFAGVVKHLVEKGRCKSYNETLSRIKPYLHADFVVVNLENVFLPPIKTLAKLEKQFVHLNADPSAVKALTYAGINHVSLANNHMLDFGEEGARYTAHVVKKNGIRYTGIVQGDGFSPQEPMILEKNGIKVGILSYCNESSCYVTRAGMDVGMALWDVNNAIAEVKSLRKLVDIVVIYLHWGNEYTSIMTTTNMFELIRLQQSAPVDLVVGAHPHTKHVHFYTNNTLVASSLGNLLFPSHYAGSLNFNDKDHPPKSPDDLALFEKIWADQTRAIKNPSKEGKLLKVVLNKNGIIRTKTKYLKYEIIPSKKTNCLMPRVQKGEDWRTVCGSHDDECAGTRTCNALECNGVVPYTTTTPQL